MAHERIEIGVKYFMANKNPTHSDSVAPIPGFRFRLRFRLRIGIWLAYCYCLTARQILHIFVWPAFYCCCCYMSILLLMSHIVTVVRRSVCIWMPTVASSHRPTQAHAHLAHLKHTWEALTPSHNLRGRAAQWAAIVIWACKWSRDSTMDNVSWRRSAAAATVGAL